MYCQEFKDFFVFDWELALELVLVDRQASQGSCFSFGNHYGEFELGNKASCFLS